MFLNIPDNEKVMRSFAVTHVSKNYDKEKIVARFKTKIEAENKLKEFK